MQDQTNLYVVAIQNHQAGDVIICNQKFTFTEDKLDGKKRLLSLSLPKGSSTTRSAIFRIEDLGPADNQPVGVNQYRILEEIPYAVVLHQPGVSVEAAAVIDSSQLLIAITRVIDASSHLQLSDQADRQRLISRLHKHIRSSI